MYNKNEDLENKVKRLEEDLEKMRKNYEKYKEICYYSHFLGELTMKYIDEWIYSHDSCEYIRPVAFIQPSLLKEHRIENITFNVRTNDVYAECSCGEKILVPQDIIKASLDKISSKY